MDGRRGRARCLSARALGFARRRDRDAIFDSLRASAKGGLRLQRAIRALALSITPLKAKIAARGGIRSGLDAPATRSALRQDHIEVRQDDTTPWSDDMRSWSGGRWPWSDDMRSRTGHVRPRRGDVRSR